jgi:hypothetical protein
MLLNKCRCGQELPVTRFQWRGATLADIEGWRVSDRGSMHDVILTVGAGGSIVYPGNCVRNDPPPIVCLCGSTRFWKVFQEESLRLTLEGKIVLSVGAAVATDEEHFGHLSEEEKVRIKEDLDELHLRKIDLADEVLILNVDGYIGESTRRELEYARKKGKKVRFLEPANEA